MNNPEGIAAFWLLIMLTALKLFSIIFLCSININVEKLAMFKQKEKTKESQQVICFRNKREELLTRFKSYLCCYYYVQIKKDSSD